MKIDLKKLIQKILDHRRWPKIFVVVFTILLSCISFSSAISFGVSTNYNVGNPSYYQFSPINDLQDNSITDWFMCFEIYWWKFNNFSITDNNWNNIFYLYWQDIENSASPLCFFLSDFSQSYNLMIQSNYNISVYYFYVYALPTPPTPQISCYTWLMNIRLINWNSNTQNNIYYEFSPYSPNEVVYSVYFTWVNSTSMQNWILLEWNDCSSIQSDLNTCSNNFQSCQGYLSSCQSDLSTATGYIDSLEWEIAQCSQDLINCSSSSSSWSCESWSNWSALYINDIQHLWKPNIFITIPEEINWSYTSEWDDFDLNVSWYNVDTEYIEWVIDIQNTKPSQDDFNRIISEVIPLFVPWLFIVLFIYFVFRFVKKVF